MDDQKKLLQKIYFKLIELDFDSMTFHNHILLNKIIDELRQNFEGQESDLPPPLPPDVLPSNVLSIKPPGKNHYKIMLVDDDPGIQDLVKYALKSEGAIELIIERSPRLAILHLPETRPDLMLVDIMMKEMTCFEFLTQVKLLELPQDLDIVVGSYQANQHEKNVALELGATDYIVKPYDVNELKFKLRLKYRRKLKHG